MPTLHVVFREGFDRDLAVMRLDAKEVFRKADLTTRTMVGRAHIIDMELESKPLQVEVELPARGLKKAVRIDPSRSLYLGISIDPEGELVLEVSFEPFRDA